MHIEIIHSRTTTPEVLLLHVGSSARHCTAEVIVGDLETDDSSLQTLESLYDYLDPAIYVVQQEQGYILVKTGITNQYEDFSVAVVCKDTNNNVVYDTTIIEQSTSSCSILKNGRLLIC